LTHEVRAKSIQSAIFGLRVLDFGQRPSVKVSFLYGLAAWGETKHGEPSRGRMGRKKKIGFDNRYKARKPREGRGRLKHSKKKVSKKKPNRPLDPLASGQTLTPANDSPY